MAPVSQGATRTRIATTASPAVMKTNTASSPISPAMASPVATRIVHNRIVNLTVTSTRKNSRLLRTRRAVPGAVIQDLLAAAVMILQVEEMVLAARVAREIQVIKGSTKLLPAW